jgi:uncharacterized coiled-coil protein SlyX
MPSNYEALVELLEQERIAARRADMDTLLQLQEVKRQVIQKLARQELPPHQLNELTAKARSNIWLLRHLVQCLGGALGEENSATYTHSAGFHPSPPHGTPRGNV